MRVSQRKDCLHYFFLDPEQRHPINVFLVGETHPNTKYECIVHEPQEDKKARTFESHQLEYIISGEITVDIDRKKVRVSEGEFVHIQSGISRRLYSETKKGVRKLYVTASGPLLDGILAAHGMTSHISVVRVDVREHFENIMEICKKNLEHDYMYCDEIGRELLSVVQKVYNTRFSLLKIGNINNVKQVKDYIDLNYNKRLTMQELCENFFKGKTQLKENFKSKYKMTPIQYLQKKRILMAEYYLSETDIQITQLSDMLGFTDASHFSKNFKKHIGKSPVLYRKEKRKTEGTI